MWAVRDAIGLIADYPHYLTPSFWDDLKKRGVDFPFYLPTLLASLSRKPSELLRAIADYIDADKAPASRLEATEKLYEYAEQVMSRCAKELNWREIRERYCPDYPRDGDGSYRNFQGFLRERGIPFRPVGEFRGGRRKCVRKRKKDTQLPQSWYAIISPGVTGITPKTAAVRARNGEQSRAPGEVPMMPVPPYLRLPKPKERCPYTSFSRTTLVELCVPTAANNFRPPVRALCIKTTATKKRETGSREKARHLLDTCREAFRVPQFANCRAESGLKMRAPTGRLKKQGRLWEGGPG
jgi:hypothetical protein